MIGVDKIRLSNFKSISKTSPPTEIELSPLTILCGENSSGKSTVLHSMLLLIQSLSSTEASDKSFNLNGDLIKLNDVRSVQHYSSEEVDTTSTKEDQYKELKKTEQPIEIGIDFNTLLFRSERWNSPTNVNVKFDIALKPSINFSEQHNYGEVLPFPVNESTSIQVTGTREISDSDTGEPLLKTEKTILDFSELPITQKINVNVSGGTYASQKKFSNSGWVCRHKNEESVENVSLINTGENIYDGIEFISGIPSKVSKRTLLSQYLTKKLSNELELFFSDEEDMKDLLFFWYKNKNPESAKLNKLEIIDNLTKTISSDFDILETEEDLNQLKEHQAIKSPLPEDGFSIGLNLYPNLIFGLGDRKFYTTKSQVAEALVDFVATGIDDDYIGIAIQNIVPSIATRIELEKDNLDENQDIAELEERINYLELSLEEMGLEMEMINQKIEEADDEGRIYTKSPSEEALEIEYQKMQFQLEEALYMREDMQSPQDDSSNQEEIMEALYEEFISIVDRTFFRKLETELQNKFELLFHEDDSEELYFVELNSQELKDDEAKNEIAEANNILMNLRKAAQQIKYIGPLRKLENNEKKKRDSYNDKNIPMGVNGEYFFNFYETNKSEPYVANYYPKGEFEVIPISEKFDEMLQFFGIAQKFSTKYDSETDTIQGFITPIGLNKSLKMKELGVGFSQLAPIILLCLTSDRGSTILLEQPELHLHPQVQQKFADFMIEMMTENDLQIILETHSDHMLNRVRRRIAQAKLEENNSTLFEKCTILFAEREEGVTEFRKANLTKSGTYDLTDFPKGFFDQGAEDAFFILKASMEEDNS